jgi:hypothetical protein
MAVSIGGRFPLMQFGESISQSLMRFSIAGSNSHRLAIAGAGEVSKTALQITVSQVVMVMSNFRMNGDSAPNQFNGVWEILSLQCNHSAEVQGIAVARVFLQNLLVKPLGFFKSAGAMHLQRGI